MIDVLHTPLEFFGETLAAADGDRFTGEKFTHMLDELFAAGKGDPEVQMTVMLRKGNDVFLIGLKDGKIIHEKAAIKEMLSPVLNRL
jgi:hypothetical protein